MEKSTPKLFAKKAMKVMDSDLFIIPWFIVFFACFQFLFLKTMGEILPKTYLRISIHAVGLGFLCGSTSIHKRARILTTIAFAGLVLMGVACVAYKRYFGVIPNLNTLSLFGQSASILGFVPYCLQWDLLLVLLWAIVVPIPCFFRGSRGIRKWLVIVGIGCFIPNICFIILGYATPTDNAVADSRLTDAYYYDPEYGIGRYGYLTYLFVNRASVTQSVYGTNLPAPLPDKRTISQKAKGFNLIIMQMESLDAELIGKTVNGHSILPCLSELAKKGVYCPHFYSTHGMGGSSDAEYAVLTGLFPPSEAPAFSFYKLNELPSLFKTLASHGYGTAVFHGNRGSYWNRKNAMKQLGATTFHDADSYTGKARGFRSMDDAFFLQTVPMLKELRRNGPFVAYMISQSLHGPFMRVNAPFNNELTADDGQVENYFKTARYVDHSFSLFMDSLYREGFLKNTIVILFGDHTSSLKTDAYDCGKSFGERVPLLILAPQLSGKIPFYGSHVDVAPTVCDLLGIEPDPRWIGRTLLKWTPTRLFPLDYSHGHAFLFPGNQRIPLRDADPLYRAAQLYCRSNFSPVDENAYKSLIGMVAGESSTRLANVQAIAHAMGKIDGKAYTNSYEAFSHSYGRGQRWFEAEFVFTSDGHMIAAHGGLEGRYSIDAPFYQKSWNEIIGKRFDGKYTLLDVNDVLGLLKSHPDTYLVTDFKANFKLSLDVLTHACNGIDPSLKTRIVPQIYKPGDVLALRENSYPTCIFTLYQSSMTNQEVLVFVQKNSDVVGAVCMPEKRVSKRFVKELRDLGMAVFVHTVNDIGTMLHYQGMGVTGFYTDGPEDPVIWK